MLADFGECCCVSATNLAAASPELTAVCSGKTVQILIDAARPCGGGVAAQDDATPLELRKR
jgi:hypothetical protein